MKNFLLLLISLFIVFILFEIYLRIFNPQIFVHPPGMYSVDQEVGYILTPGFNGFLERDEFVSPVSINSIGLRDKEISNSKNETRILCLGDSYTFGFGVDADSAYPQQLESMLVKNSDKKFKVINAGVSGYGTADQLALLKSRVNIFKPDIIIVQFLSVNDFEENRYPAKGRFEIKDGMLRTKVFHGDPYDDLPATQKILIWLKSNIHSAKFISERVGYLAMKWGILGNADEFWGENFSENDVEITRGYFEDLKKECERIGSDLIVLYIVGQGHVIDDKTESLKSEKVIENICNDLNIPLINTLQLMRKRDDRFDLYFPIDGHWTTHGHFVIAEILSDHLANNNFTEN